MPELFGRTSALPLTTALPANSGNTYQRGSVPHDSTACCHAPLSFGTDVSAPLIWDAPSPRVGAGVHSIDPSFEYDEEDSSGEEVFSPGWDRMGQEAEVILNRYLGSTYQAVQAPREAATASTENTHGPIFFPVQV